MRPQSDLSLDVVLAPSMDLKQWPTSRFAWIHRATPASDTASVGTLACSGMVVETQTWLMTDVSKTKIAQREACFSEATLSLKPFLVINCSSACVGAPLPVHAVDTTWGKESNRIKSGKIGLVKGCYCPIHHLSFLKQWKNMKESEVLITELQSSRKTETEIVSPSQS